MIIRFVKLTFQEEYVAGFLELVNQRKERIRNFKGCTYLQIVQDIHQPNIIFSHSHWDSEADLNNYRNSEFFGGIWRETKPKFSAKAEAWSVENIYELP